MATEIERTWLVEGDDWRGSVTSSSSIVQAYLAIADDRTVRVRVRDAQAVLTVKTGTGGHVREEVEVPLDPAGARRLVDSDAVVGTPVVKTRHLVPIAGGLVAEVDEFDGANAPLVLVEVELPDVDTPVATPDWFGAEVTGDPRYLNARLSLEPYRRWGRA